MRSRCGAGQFSASRSLYRIEPTITTWPEPARGGGPGAELVALRDVSSVTVPECTQLFPKLFYLSHGKVRQHVIGDVGGDLGHTARVA